MDNIILLTSIFFTGVAVSTTFFMFLFGMKSIGTRFHALFFGYLCLFLIFLILKDIGVSYMGNVINKMHYLIPFFYILFLYTQHNNRFSYKVLLFVLIPIFLIIIPQTALSSVLYHAFSWAILITITIKLFKNPKSDDVIHEKQVVHLVLFLIGFSLIPFVVLNVIFIIIYGFKNVTLMFFPMTIAITAVLDFYFSYKINFLNLDHSYYADMDFLRKSMSVEKQTIIEKISAGLIHEIKNPITAIQSLNQQLLSRINQMDKESVIKYLVVISEETDRIKDLAENYLKNFRQSKKGEVSIINLYDILDSIGKLLKPDLLKNNIVLDIESATKNVIFSFNNGELRQIFINLIYNAIEAGADKISIKSKKSLEMFEIFVSDNGVGIDHKNMDNLFRPFFSTKMDGTGVGLSISKEILNSYFGQLEVFKSDTSGTTFKITIPFKE